MNHTPHPLMIIIAGPYRSGTNDDPHLITENVHAMNRAALQVYRAGHIPILGEWLALPLIETAGSQKIGDEIFTEIFHPIAHAIAQRCDACLRIGGPSQGADGMVHLAQSLGRQVFYRLEDIPGYAGDRQPDSSNNPV
ncbi:MAG: DUF4406 domain-containing protein [Chloroflexia bacterium]